MGHHRPVGQLFLAGVRYVDRHQIVPVPRHKEDIHPHHRVVVRSPASAVHRHTQAGFLVQLYLAHNRSRGTIRLGLAERLRPGKGFLAIPAEGLQAGTQGLVQQLVAGRLVIVCNLAGLFVQRQGGQGLLDYQQAVVQRLGALDGFLVGGARYLVLRHPGYKDRLDGCYIKLTVKGGVPLQQIVLGTLAQPLDQFIPEVGPRGGEALAGTAVHRTAAVRLLQIGSLDAMVVAGDLLYHPLGGTGDDRRVQSVVQVSVRPHLGQPPPFAQMTGHAAGQRHHPLLAGSRVIGKGQMVPDIVQQKAGHVLGILQIALFEAGLFFFAQRFPQKIFLLAVVAYLGLGPYDELLPALSLQILQRQTVALLAVFGSQNQHLVAAGIVEADAVRDNVVHLGIARLKQMLGGNVLQRIGTAVVLLLPEPVFDQILPGGLQQMEGLPDLLHQPLVLGGVLFHGLFGLAALFQRAAQFPGQLQMQPYRRLPHLPDDGIYHLDGLGNSPAHHRAGDVLQFRRRCGQFGRLFGVVVGVEIQTGLGACLVVGQPLEQPGVQHPTGFQGNMPGAGKIQPQQGIHLGRRQAFVGQQRAAGILVPVQRQQGDNFIPQGKIRGICMQCLAQGVGTL